MLRGVPEQCCQSFLWDPFVRDDVTVNKIPEQVPLGTSQQKSAFLFDFVFTLGVFLCLSCFLSVL